MDYSLWLPCLITTGEQCNVKLSNHKHNRVKVGSLSFFPLKVYMQGTSVCAMMDPPPLEKNYKATDSQEDNNVKAM